MKLPARFRRKPNDIVGQEADALMQAYGAGAYDEARRRARDERLGKILDGNGREGQWEKARREIARRTGKTIGTDAASRYPDA